MISGVHDFECEREALFILVYNMNTNDEGILDIGRIQTVLSHPYSNRDSNMLKNWRHSVLLGLLKEAV